MEQLEYVRREQNGFGGHLVELHLTKAEAYFKGCCTLILNTPGYPTNSSPTSRLGWMS